MCGHPLEIEPILLSTVLEVMQGGVKHEFQGGVSARISLAQTGRLTSTDTQSDGEDMEFAPGVIGPPQHHHHVHKENRTPLSWSQGNQS